MISSSKAFRKAINKDGRVLSIRDAYIFEDGTIPEIGTRNFRSYSINQATSGNSSFDIGATIIKEYKATLDNTEGTFDTFDFENLDIWARVGLLLEDGSTEIIPKGKFRCVSAKNSENSINIKAYDSMLFFDRPYSESKLTYPATINQIVADACQCCEMAYDASSIKNGDYMVQDRPDDGSLTFRDILGFCAQIMCCYASINHLDQLTFGWYDFDTLTNLQSSYDGGSFGYSDGDSLDGGNFTDYSSGDSADGGTFEEQKKYHHIYSLGSRSINTDDIEITGIAVKASSDYVEDDTIHLCGEEGYVLLVEDNPLIQSDAQADVVAEYIGEKMNGKKFRPLNVSCKSNPCIEAGDCACVTDRKNRTYFTVITDTTFAFGSLQKIECTAVTPTEKNYTKYSAVTKLLDKAKTETKKQISNYDLAVQQLANLMSMSFGMFITKEVQEDGSVIEYQHNKPNLADSSTIWKKTADAFAVSTDGGETWNAGMDAEGNAVLNILNAIGINADWVKAGTIRTSAFEASGVAVKNASDYTQDDVDRANAISLGNIVPAVEDFEKLDINGDGVIDIIDIIKINGLVNGTIDKVEIPTKLIINPFVLQNVLQTEGVRIGMNSAYFKNLTSDTANLNHVKVLENDTGYRDGITGKITINGQTIEVVKGIIVSGISE